jgi:P4 family phage/plasmid primase-like protien
MHFYTNKSIAIENCSTSQIVCNSNITKYFVVDSYTEFGNIICASNSPCYYEFIRDNTLFNPFFDIEIYKSKSPDEFENSDLLVNNVITTFRKHIEPHCVGCQFQVIVLKSHTKSHTRSLTKKSYHVIIRITESNRLITFNSLKDFKNIIFELFPDYTKRKIIDTSVYREGLFRTYLSSKQGEQRPLVKHETLSDPFEVVDTFVGFTPNPQIIQLKPQMQEIQEEQIDLRELSDLKELSNDDCSIISKYVRKYYKYRSKDIRDVFIDRKLNCIIVSLNDTFCHNIDREHRSNHQYIVIDTNSSKQKCHDLDCKDYKHEEIKVSNFPKEVNEILLKCLKVNKKEQELIEKAIHECKDYINNNFDETFEDIQFDRSEMVFKGNASESNSLVRMNGKCNNCILEHRITNDGYCLKCKVCNSIYPKNQLIPLDTRYKNLNNFWSNYNSLVNHGTVVTVVNNYYNGEEEFSCDVQLDSGIFSDPSLTKMFNQILDGHKVVVISQLMHKLECDFKYTNGDWYFFNGMIWKQDKESLEFRKRIVKLSLQFSHIQHYYESKKAGDSFNSNIIKNVKSLVNKLHKISFADEIIKGAKMYYNDEHFTKNLNSKKHLVPFSNGVFDLLENTFRKTKKEDYVNLILGYDYDKNVDNPEVHQFIEQILPNKAVRDFVLKKMSECLNGDIPNTNFLMFIGDGANGKSQLLNLMKLAMGELGEKVEVTLLTRKRNNANEANTEKIKLMYKRFAFLSEPEDGEKINIGLLKELTGSEEIVARGLYQESVSFVMEAKLFLACNELPEIRGEDTALWRRIRVVDFPSRFVDNPKENNEYKIDRTLPSRMREDVTWRQTFINILLDYYFKDNLSQEPVEVQVKTNEYRAENNPLETWLAENIVENQDSVIHLKDVCYLCYQKELNNKEKSRVKKEVEKWINKTFPHIDHLCKESRFNGIKYNGWKGLDFSDS